MPNPNGTVRVTDWDEKDSVLHFSSMELDLVSYLTVGSHLVNWFDNHRLGLYVKL